MKGVILLCYQPRLLTPLDFVLSLVDYFLIRRTNVKVSNLLNRDKTSIYWYYSGFNWRAFIAVLGTIWLPIRTSLFPFQVFNIADTRCDPLPDEPDYVTAGWIMVIRKDESLLDGPWQKIYGLAWMLSFVTASSIYYILSRLWPMCVDIPP